MWTYVTLVFSTFTDYFSTRPNYSKYIVVVNIITDRTIVFGSKQKCKTIWEYLPEA